LGCQILGPVGAAVTEVIAITDQTLLELPGEQRDEVEPSLVTEAVPSGADLAATTG